jgi:hypothetical protein
MLCINVNNFKKTARCIFCLQVLVVAYLLWYNLRSWRCFPSWQVDAAHSSVGLAQNYG